MDFLNSRFCPEYLMSLVDKTYEAGKMFYIV